MDNRISNPVDHEQSTGSTARRVKNRSRINAACVRCQKRKIRCDGLLPACSMCQKAGVECIDGGTSREIPRAYVSDLEARVEWLESIVRENCPSIDLNRGPCARPRTSRPARLATGSPSNGAVTSGSQQNMSFSNESLQDPTVQEVSNQIGLVSLSAGTDLKYLGPSSGMFFTRFVLAGLSKEADIRKSSYPTPSPQDGGLSIPTDLLKVQAQGLPKDHKHTEWLSQVYFESVHLQYPFLHKPTHMEMIRKLYDGEDVGSGAEFQLFMVLAIGATIASRRVKAPLSAEGFYASAINLLDDIFRDSSVQGVQSILLLEMYTMNNPSSGLSLWSLHYHCLSNILDLGLQRDLRGTKYFTPFQQEMRTRIFWCVYTMDRVLSTLMGRPIGLADEQCELRLPRDISDEDVMLERSQSRQHGESLNNMSSAIHLFKMARLNSEVKCVLYCVERQYSTYRVPAIVDVKAWQRDILDRLRKWKEEIPRHPEDDPRSYLNDWCEIKYHELAMLVLRPSPLFHQPTKEAIQECFSSALNCSNLYGKLYLNNTLHYSWISVHSIFLSVITMFYCVWTSNGVADEVDFDSLAQSLKSTSDILSATGEYWPEAKRSRDIFDRISIATTKRFTRNSTSRSLRDAAPIEQIPITQAATNTNIQTQTDFTNMDMFSQLLSSVDNGGVISDPFPPFYGAPLDSFMNSDLLQYFMGTDIDVNMTTSDSFNSYGYGLEERI